MKMKDPDMMWCFAITSLNIKIKNKSYEKRNNASKQTCLQIIALLNITTNTSIKKIGKQINKNTTTNTT